MEPSTEYVAVDAAVRPKQRSAGRVAIVVMLALLTMVVGAAAGALGMHLIVATAFTMVPAYHAVHTCLAAPGASAFCVLRGGC